MLDNVTKKHVPPRRKVNLAKYEDHKVVGKESAGHPRKFNYTVIEFRNIAADKRSLLI